MFCFSLTAPIQRKPPQETSYSPGRKRHEKRPRRRLYCRAPARGSVLIAANDPRRRCEGLSAAGQKSVRGVATRGESERQERPLPRKVMISAKFFINSFCGKRSPWRAHCTAWRSALSVPVSRSAPHCSRANALREPIARIPKLPFKSRLSGTRGKGGFPRASRAPDPPGNEDIRGAQRPPLRREGAARRSRARSP